MSLRTDIEKRFYEITDAMDPSGKNTNRVKAFFKPMSDKQFYQHINDYFENPDKLFAIAYEPYNNPVSIKFVHDVARKFKVPIYEIVYMPYVDGNAEDPPGTVNPILVLDLPVKRLKQMGFLKNHASTSASKRDAKTGQVTGEDRTARVTDVEGYSLLAEGQYNFAQEAYGPMADDMEAHYEMLRIIQRDGEVELRDLPNDPTSKTTMNTINAYMIGSGLESNFIDESGYLLPITLKGREDKTSTIRR